jgi:hypothetical protein
VEGNSIHSALNGYENGGLALFHALQQFRILPKASLKRWQLLTELKQ